jgi:hypothetical protein
LSDERPLKTKTKKNLHLPLTALMVNIDLISASSRYFIVFSSRSVQAPSSISNVFEFDEEVVEGDGRGKMYSVRILSTSALYGQRVQGNIGVLDGGKYLTAGAVLAIWKISLGIHENCRMAAGSLFSLFHVQNECQYFTKGQ